MTKQIQTAERREVWSIVQSNNKL